MNHVIFDVEARVNKSLLRQAFPQLTEGIDFTRFAFDQDKGETRDATEEERDAAAYQEFLGRFRLPNGRAPMAPLACHIPIAIAYGQVDGNFNLLGIETKAVENDLVLDFWRRYEAFDGRLVSFNGRGYDLPLLDLHAMKLGLSAPLHMAKGRDRYRATRHIDLMDAVRMDMRRGGLDLIMQFLGGPAKSGIDGSLVQEYWDAGELELIAGYCGDNVLRTYILFLRYEMLRGNLGLEQVVELEGAAMKEFATR